MSAAITPAEQNHDEGFRPGTPIVVVDHRGRRRLTSLTPGRRYHLTGGHFEMDVLVGAPAGIKVLTSGGNPVFVYPATLDEYVTMMPRCAQIVLPKDIAFICHWADIEPGMTVVEAGLGSGALSLGLLRAVGPTGLLKSFEIRPEFISRAKKNLEGWPTYRASTHQIINTDVVQGLQELRGIDRVVLDMPGPQLVVDAAAAALRPNGVLVAYLPNIRQVDELVLKVLGHSGFGDPEVTEVLVRPWVADRTRLRPAQHMISHTGFLVRARHLKRHI